MRTGELGEGLKVQGDTSAGGHLRPGVPLPTCPATALAAGRWETSSFQTSLVTLTTLA